MVVSGALAKPVIASRENRQRTCENEGLEKTRSGAAYAGTGIAMLTLIESTARVMIRNSDSEPIASVAATAFLSRVEATGAGRSLKPRAPDDGVMA
jgi:hypothetical protein